MLAPETVVFLQGLGERPDVWDAQRAALPRGFLGVAVDTLALVSSEAPSHFRLAHVAGSLAQELDRLGIQEAHVCGLSLGAVIALQFVLEYPERVRSVTLAAGVVKPPRALMLAQAAVVQLIPRAIFERQGLPKRSLLSALRAVQRLDVSDSLASVAVPTLVLCGSKDFPNLAAAQHLARGIPRARLQLIPNAGHRSHVQAPERFAHALGAFLRKNSQATGDDPGVRDVPGE